MLRAREVIEPALASEAAIHGSEQDFAEMDDSIARMQDLQGQRDQDAFLAENRAFHGVIARAGGNKVLESFWLAISVLASGEQHGVRYSVGNQQHVITAHQHIVQACRQRDAAAAAEAMQTHVNDLENLVRVRDQGRLAHPTSVVSRKGRGAG